MARSRGSEWERVRANYITLSVSLNEQFLSHSFMDIINIIVLNINPNESKITFGYRI